MSFKELGLSDPILRAIADCGYDTPTPIQAQAIPHILMARDLVGLAQTGTGKTAGFTLPMIEILSGGRARARMPRSLVLTPTRELAAQVAENFDTYGKYSKLTKALLTGGTSMEEQIKLLDRGVDVLIATPGRMLDLFERGKILLSDIKILVIDEADRMMDMGFIPDIEKIVGLLPQIRQTLLFSATMPPEIRKLTQKFQMNPREVSVAAPSSTAEKVKQFIVWTHPKKKREVLDAILQKENVQNAFVFCNRKRDIADLTRWLENHNYAAKGMHGDMTQSIRTRTLEEFRDGEVSLLICSDVAARGLDVDDVSHVFNYDVPLHAEDYVHRIGRTGRAGKEGRAWTLATSEEDKQARAIEKLIGKKIEVVEIGGGSKPPRDDSREEKPVREERSGGHDRNRNNRNRPQREGGRKDEGRQHGRGHDSRRRDEAPQQPRHEGKGDRQQQRSESGHRRPEQPQEDHPRGFGSDVPGFFGKN
jgi:superfamily II DNA/RNA helicase